MPRTHPTELVLLALSQVAQGATTEEVARGLGISRWTVNSWRRGNVPVAVRHRLDGTEPQVCPSCGGPSHTLAAEAHAAYAYLLGVYLGDGCISEAGRRVSLRVSLDIAYPGIIEEVQAAIGCVLSGKCASAWRRPGENVVVLTAYSRAWLCLFPQHGPGRKHERAIRLAQWQQRICDEHPGPLLRGLIHTDGWRGANRVHVKGRDYEYSRYQFSSRSDDIRGIFTDACDRLGIAWRPWGPYHVSVARRGAVARLDEHVGPKR